MIDPKVRNDFYGLDDKTFFNNASYAPVLKVVKQSIDDYLAQVMKLDVGDAPAKVHLADIRQYAATLIGAQPDEIEFAINTSWGLNLAALGLDWQAGDEVLMPDNEFPSVPYPFRSLAERSVVVKYIPTPERNFSFEEMAKLVTKHTKVLAISFVQYFNGYRNDIKALGEFCKERDIYFIVDAIQGLGVCPLNVKECYIDLLACGAQKWLLSPLGSGFFYVSKQAKRKLRSLTTGWLGVDWHLNYTDLLHFDREPFEDCRRFNLGTYPYIQLWGMAAALKYMVDLGTESIFKHNMALVDRLLTYVRNDDYYKVNGTLDPAHLSQIVNISSPANQALQKFLLQNDFLLVYREGGVRIAVNFYNTTQEIDRLIEVLKQFKVKEAGLKTQVR